MAKDITVSGESESRIKIIEAGVHLAKLYCIADVGTHYDERFEKHKHEVVFIWELPDERIELERDGQQVNLPRAISKTYTLNIGEKANLRRDLVLWRGRDFTPEELKRFSLSTVLGKSCQLQVVHKVKGDKTYANIGGIMSAPKGCKHEAPENPLVMWEVGDDPALVPKWVVEKAMQSDEWKARENPPTIEPPTATTDDEETDDCVPF